MYVARQVHFAVEDLRCKTDWASREEEEEEKKNESTSTAKKVSHFAKNSEGKQVGYNIYLDICYWKWQWTT